MVSDVNHRNAAKKLKAQLEEWLACFTNYVSSHKAYIKALHDCARHPLPAFCEETNNNALSLLELEKWSSCLDKLFADVTVTKAIGDLATKVGELLELQNQEYKHKRQVELEGEHYKTEKSSKTKDKSYKFLQRIKEEEVETEKSSKTKDKSYKFLQRIKEEEVEYEASRKETEKNAVILVRTGFTSLLDPWMNSRSLLLKSMMTLESKTKHLRGYLDSY